MEPQPLILVDQSLSMTKMAIDLVPWFGYYYDVAAALHPRGACSLDGSFENAVEVTNL